MQMYIYGGNNSERQTTTVSDKPETPEIKSEPPNIPAV